MKIKVSDYIADFLVQNNINTVFTVVGGGAMFLNDSFGHHKGINCIYNHHEQASSIAAEAYARINNTIAVVCVTSGPGAINALNGVAGGYLDSIPMLIISGQTKSTLTVKNSGLKLRSLGNQEFDIINTVKTMTKYSEMVTSAKSIKYHLERALKTAYSGRPGPCWIDIPLDIQSMFIEENDLIEYSHNEKMPCCSRNEIKEVINQIAKASRPVIYAGNGIRIASAYHEFREVVDVLGIPVVTGWNSIDLIPTEHNLYAGRAGTMGDRAGNFAVQNSDLVIAIGSRLNIYQVGYNAKTWARRAYVIVVDIDSEELKKQTIHINLPICSDAKYFLQKLKENIVGNITFKKREWNLKCEEWKRNYPVIQVKHYSSDSKTNVYAFMHELSKELPLGAITVVANGTASVVGSQVYIIREGQRFIMNCALSSMGYDLPAAIGACVASGYKDIFCIAGDGSIQMNIQELQTIITNSMPIKIFIINNQGYHQIRQTQANFFSNGLIGVGPDSKDLDFPDFEKVSYTYNYNFLRCQNNDQIKATVKKALEEKGALICEVVVSTNQIFEPKSSARKLDDGTLVSPPLEDMAPFLSREELKENMIIDII